LQRLERRGYTGGQLTLNSKICILKLIKGVEKMTKLKKPFSLYRFSLMISSVIILTIILSTYFNDLKKEYSNVTINVGLK